MQPIRRNWPSVILAVVVLAVVAAGSSTAAVLITSADIKDGTIKPRDLSGAGRTAINGAPCTIPGHGAGKIKLTVDAEGTVLLACINAWTTDNDGDDFSERDGDCDDTDPGINPGALETFNGKDDDCDGLLTTGPFYTGPPGTEGVGICHAGTRGEITSPPYYIEISPEQTPEPEIVGDEADNDCDGQVDEV